MFALSPALAFDPQAAAKQAYDSGDYATAAGFLKTLATQGDVAAQYNLGVMYMDGRGVPKDYAAAATLFGKAARQGNTLAQYNLGVMYHDGLGLETDLPRSYLWLDIAVSGLTGSEAVHAAKIRDDLAKKMTPDQLQDARDMVDSCQQVSIRNCD